MSVESQGSIRVASRLNFGESQRYESQLCGSQLCELAKEIVENTQKNSKKGNC